MASIICHKEFWYCLALLAAIAAIVTGHAAQVRDTGQTRIELFEPIIRKTNGQDDDKCKEFLIYSCPSATTRDPLSPNFGKANPQAKLACCDDHGYCYVGIIGMRNPVKPALVTVIPTTRAGLDRQKTRDKCFESNLSWAKMLVEGVLR